ncbi:hypothetical protein F5Y16DRAFT_389733 [Xylariaceae sp. FL0255]|nr:hypothetical protein F5Y16DRAFT_389733 [Xylariaceae sp. FL0255]
MQWQMIFLFNILSYKGSLMLIALSCHCKSATIRILTGREGGITQGSQLMTFYALTAKQLCVVCGGVGAFESSNEVACSGMHVLIKARYVAKSLTNTVGFVCRSSRGGLAYASPSGLYMTSSTSAGVLYAC